MTIRTHATACLRRRAARGALVLWLGGWLIAAVAGPFGTFQTMDLGGRALFWGAVITAGVVIGIAADALCVTLGRGRATLWTDAVATLVTASVLTPIIMMINMTCAMVGPGWIWINTVVFVGAAFVLRRYLGQMDHSARPRLLLRLPQALRGARVLRLSGRDHSVEVGTDRGTITLRLRLSDAINEMEPVQGICTHRSHWVVLSAVTGFVCDGGKPFITLAGGDRVPVSRTYRPALEARGLVPVRESAG